MLLREHRRNIRVIVSQSDLALSAGNTYAMSFTAEGESGREITVKSCRTGIQR